jgi:hypothetical protein
MWFPAPRVRETNRIGMHAATMRGGECYQTFRFHEWGTLAAKSHKSNLRKGSISLTTSPMTLSDVIQLLDTFRESDTIYVTSIEGNWSPDSLAEVGTEPEMGGLPPEVAQDAQYFLEVWLAKEVIEVAQNHFKNTKPILDLSDRVKAVIHYAERDAYIQEL